MINEENAEATKDRSATPCYADLINKAIADSLEWKLTDGYFSFPWFNEKGKPRQSTPDYCNDLNAMREVIITLIYEQRITFIAELAHIARSTDYSKYDDEALVLGSMIILATPAQWAEAYLITIGKWDDLFIA